MSPEKNARTILMVAVLTKAALERARVHEKQARLLRAATKT